MKSFSEYSGGPAGASGGMTGSAGQVMWKCLPGGQSCLVWASGQRLRERMRSVRSNTAGYREGRGADIGSRFIIIMEKFTN